MDPALRSEPERLYTRHTAATDRGSWSVVGDIRWGDIDVRRASAQPDVLETVRRFVLELSGRGARTARLLASFAADTHVSAALTLELWDGLKHMHALRTYLDSVEAARVSDEDIASARIEPPLVGAVESPTGALIRLILTQHVFAAALRRLGGRAEEPVLAELLALMAADEIRHAQVGTDLMSLLLRAGTSTAAQAREELARLRQKSDDLLWPADDLTVQTFTRRMESLCENA